MAAFNLLDQAAPLLKRYYDDRTVYSMAYKNRPLYGWVPKKTGITGGAVSSTPSHGYIMPLTIDDIPGESARFADAVTARDGDSHVAWTLFRIKRYATATIDWETVRAMKNDVGAFMRAITPRINSAINQVSNTVAAMSYTTGTGARGVTTAATAGTTNTVVLTSPLEARRFSLRRTCVLVAAANPLGAPIAGTAKITGINLATATLTFDDVPDLWASTNGGVGNHLFLLGDTAASGVSVCQDGLGSWGPAPAGVVAGVFFKGVERAKYKEKLLMLHYEAMADNSTIDADIRNAAATLQANEGSPDTLFLSPDRWSALETKLVTSARYEMMMGTDASTGFDSIVINAGGKKVNVVSDPWCPPNQGFLLQRDTWELFSIDRFPDFVTDDGNRLHRLEQADEVEFRIGGYYNLACRAPGHNMVINFTGT